MTENNLMVSPLLQNRTLYHFHELCQIPRGSKNEKEVSSYILKWAAELGLLVGQDALFNLMIKKAGSPGFEGASPVLLQAHLDMVCEKKMDSNHDFFKDPIPWEVEGDWIRSAVHTSLGADCGIGVALIMSILEDKNLVHPPLEVLLTVREETDMEGAYRAEPAFFKADRMINLDIGQSGRMLAGSCGGMALEMKIPVQYAEIPEGYVGMRLMIDGLNGGHSGVDIHKGRGNAALLAFRLLEILYNQVEEIGLVDLKAGTSRLAIPRIAEISVTIPQTQTECVRKLCEGFAASVSEQYETLRLLVTIMKGEDWRAVKKAAVKTEVEKIISAGLLFPCGIQEMSGLQEGSVESSSNLGIVLLGSESLCLTEEIRSVYQDTRDLLVTKARLLAGLLGGECKVHSAYPEWRFNKSSPLREKILKLSKEYIGREMEVYTAHAGNEAGILFSVLSLKDVVAIGPERCFFHSPDERLSISSTMQYEIFLKRILKELT